MKQRILFTSYSADWVGPTNSLLLLVRHLRSRYDVAVLLRGYGRFSEELEREGITFFSRDALDKWSIPAITKLLREERFNLVYANETHGGSRNAFIASRLAGVPFVNHVRSMGWNASWLRLGYLWAADAVIAVSHACASSIARYVRPERLHVVHNGVQVDGLSCDRGIVRNAVLCELGLEPNALVLLSVAHVCPRKAQEYAIEAMPNVLSSFPTAHLLLVGSLDRDPEYVMKLRTRTRRLGLQDHVHFVGYRADMSRLLFASDIFVHTAVGDPHPRAVIEAMAAQLPVVAFPVDGVAETVVDGETGRLVEYPDCIAFAGAVAGLGHDPQLRERMGAESRSRVQRLFSNEATGEKIGRIVQQVLGSRVVVKSDLNHSH